MDRKFLEQLVLKHVARPHYQPVKPRVIAKQLDVDDLVLLKKAIKKLVKKEQLRYGPGHLVLAADGKTAAAAGSSPPGGKTVTGEFRRAAAGFGFVRPRGTLASEGREKDIYIPRTRTQDAANGDIVLVRISSSRTQRDGQPPRVSGDIVEIIERETHQFVGNYLERAGDGLVQIDGNVFQRPIYVGDAGAKNARVGDKVVVEMVHFPSQKREGEGVIVEVLGPRGAPGIDTLTILREFGLPGEFSEAVLDDARRQAEAFTESIEGRGDFTGDTVITIDPIDARDFDDAISLVRLENGHWKLGVHIADVAHFVPAKSALEDEARERATSIYLPDRVIPMLPEIISNNLASLQPDRVRYTITAFLEMTPEGARVHTEVQLGAIKSARRFTYEEVDEFLADRKTWKNKLTPQVFDLLEKMHELAMVLRKRRLAQGAVELTLPEVKIDLDVEGRVSGAHLVENTESHQVIEEFMLAANMAVAEYLRDREFDFLRRVHGSPTPRKLKALTEFVRAMGIECASLESRFEIKRVIKEVEGKPEEQAVNYAVLRSMQKAVYAPDDAGHYALASDCYCHFTSPIRRYPDLTVHRMFHRLAEGKRPQTNFAALQSLGEHCSQREQRAEIAERELKKLKLLNFLSSRIGQQMDAVVTGVESFGLFAQGTEIPAEGLIALKSMTDDYYDYDDTVRTLTGRRTGNVYRLGDAVRVEVYKVDVDRRQLDYRLIGRAPTSPARGTKKQKPAKKPKHTAKKKGKRKG